MNIFKKKLCNVCHANCSQVVLSFAIPSMLLEAPTVLYQVSFVGNFVFGNFYSISKKVRPRFSKTVSVLVLLRKKRFYPQAFVAYLYKKIHSLGIKMFYYNRGHTFVFCYLICAWVKFHINITKFT